MSSKRPTSQFDHRLHIRNFGKLSRADVRVGNFTVLAGPNNTGKSFVSKLLYSIFNALNADLEQERVFRLVSSLRFDARRLLTDSSVQVPRLRRIVSDMDNVALSYAKGDIPDLDQVASNLLERATELKRVLREATEKSERTEDDAPAPAGRHIGAREQWRKMELGRLSNSVDSLSHHLARAEDSCAFNEDELKYRLRQNLFGNFQVPNVHDLRKDQSQDLQLHVDGVLKIDDSEDELRLELDSIALGSLLETSNVVYLESPIYWKLFTPLQELRRFATFRPRARGTALTGVPDYFYDLAESLTYEYTEEMAYPEIHRWLVDDIIGGKVSVSELGEMSFEEAGRSYPLSTVATGVANIGVLAMLIERKVIDRGTMLFIDEPEAHLHTAWQAVMADALFRLAMEGVNVVIATHSADILKWLEVRLKEHPDDARFVALNRFPDPRCDEDDLAVQLAQIKRDLTKPFFDLYLRGM